jgi:hypothetical protein
VILSLEERGLWLFEVFELTLERFHKPDVIAVSGLACSVTVFFIVAGLLQFEVLSLKLKVF